jgi:hypothetical protein
MTAFRPKMIDHNAPDAKLPRSPLALARQYRTSLAIAAGVIAGMVLTAFLMGGRSDEDRTLEYIAQMQQQVAILQSQNNAGNANVASIQGQLSGLQTQLVVMQNQLAQRSEGDRSAPTTTIVQIPSSVVPQAATPTAAPVSAPATAAPISNVVTNEDKSRQINQGLMGQRKEDSSIYKQIMYSSLDINSAYAVSLATWGDQRSQLASLLEAREPSEFSFKVLREAGVVTVASKDAKLQADITKAADGIGPDGNPIYARLDQ